MRDIVKYICNSHLCAILNGCSLIISQFMFEGLPSSQVMGPGDTKSNECTFCVVDNDY